MKHIGPEWFRLSLRDSRFVDNCIYIEKKDLEGFEIGDIVLVAGAFCLNIGRGGDMILIGRLYIVQDYFDVSLENLQEAIPLPEIFTRNL